MRFANSRILLMSLLVKQLGEDMAKSLPPVPREEKLEQIDYQLEQRKKLQRGPQRRSKRSK